jgi:hypothetical protein
VSFGHLAAARVDRAAGSEALWAVPAAGIVLAVPFVAYTGLVLYHFYVRGSFVMDSGMEAFLLSRSGLRLVNPASLGGGSFSHVSPLFGLLSLIRGAFPISDPQFFAGFIGLAHALPGLAVFWTLRSGFRLQGPAGLAGAALLGIAFSFNGLALAIVRYPHFEIVIVGCVILFAVALVQRRLGVAAVCFAVALATREDAGFHIFALLFVLIAVNRWHGIPWREQRAEIGFAFAGLAYSLTVLVWHQAPLGASSALVGVYIGTPPFAKVTLDRIVLRLLFYATYRTYVILPAVIALVWAERTRNPYLIVGYVAFVPWGLLQLVANTDIAGTLSGYYAYPFMIASFWPLLGVLIERRRRGVAGGAAIPVLAFSAMLVASFAAVGQQYNPGELALADFLSPPSLSRQHRTDRAVAQLVRSKRALGRLIVGSSVAALAPNEFAPGETAPFRRPAGPADTVVYFARGYDAKKLRRAALVGGLERYYRVPGTSIRIATDRPIPTAAPIAALVVSAKKPG